MEDLIYVGEWMTRSRSFYIQGVIGNTADRQTDSCVAKTKKCLVYHQVYIRVLNVP